MATELFHVKVLDKEGTKVVLQLRIISGEQRDFYDGEGFALMLLYDPISYGDVDEDVPLAREVTLENTLDPDWVADNVADYVAAVRLYDVKNHPPAVDLEKLSGDARREFFKSDEAPTAKLEVTVTRPEWVEHIRAGAEWDTSSYDALE